MGTVHDHIPSNWLKPLPCTFAVCQHAAWILIFSISNTHATWLHMWLFDLHTVVNLLKLTIINIAGVWGMTKEEMLCVTVDAEGDRQLIASGSQETFWGV